MHERSLATMAVHPPPPARTAGSGLCAPVDRSTAFEGAGEPGYSRLANPGVEAVAAAVAALERMEAGLLFSSGTAAATATVLALVPPGGTVVAARELCSDSAHLLAREMPRLGRNVALVHVDDLEGWRRALAGGASLAFLESVSNPDLRVADLPAVAELARAAGAATVVDSTLSTPVNLRPGDHGCDLVLHSASKYLNGHSDVIAGSVSGPERLVGRVRRVQWATGACLDPAAAALLARGLRTLHLRMRTHNRNGLAVARFLEGHPEVDRVLHPLLESHPDAALARRLLDGGSGMLLVRPRGGAARARRLLGALRLIRPAPTLGGLESLAFLSGDERAGGALRLSVGVEDVDDIVADLDQALTAGPIRRPAEAAAAVAPR
jgi:cystathionine beta-lyase/cystathionine gamma-synthase